VIAHKTSNRTLFVLSHPTLKIICVTDVKITATAVQHVSPEGQKQSFDKLRTSGSGMSSGVQPRSP